MGSTGDVWCLLVGDFGGDERFCDWAVTATTVKKEGGNDATETDTDDAIS